MASLIDVDRVIFGMQKVIDERTDDKDTVAYKTFEAVITALKKEPTVDAVEVVRCKDCKFFDPNEDVMPQSGSCAYHEMIKMEWDFCSRAKMDGDGNG